jgi:hypothetical protein
MRLVDVAGGPGSAVPRSSSSMAVGHFAFRPEFRNTSVRRFLGDTTYGEECRQRNGFRTVGSNLAGETHTSFAARWFIEPVSDGNALVLIAPDSYIAGNNEGTLIPY